MKRTVIPALIVSMIVLGLSFSWAGQGYGRHGENAPCDSLGWECINRPGDFLNLTKEQREEIRTLRKTERKDLEPLREQMRQNREAMRQELENDAIDKEKLRELARSHADMKVEMHLAKRQFREKIKTVLTPEQIALREERRAKHRGFKGRHGAYGGNCKGYKY